MDQHDMPRAPKTELVTLFTTPDGKPVNVRARRDIAGNLYVTASQLRHARHRARLINGESFFLPDGMRLYAR